MNEFTSSVEDHVITPETIHAARTALERPIGLAEGLPGLFYGNTFYQTERRELFPSTWCAVSVGAAIPQPGDMQPIDLAGWPILVVRARDGGIRAFHNICRHRAMRLVREPCTAATRIICPWHAWTYDLTGKLLGMPELGGAGINSVDGFDRAQLGLKPIAVGQWLDYVFVNLDGKAAPFAEHIDPLRRVFADLNLAGLRHGGRLEDFYQGNWKLATEGGIEDYHLPFGHPQLNAHLYRNTRPLWAPDVYAGGAVAVADESSVDDSPSGGSATDAAGAANGTESRPWNARLPALTRRDGRVLTELLVLNVFPTGTILVAADHVMLGMVLPDGPSRTKVDLHLYFDGDAAKSTDLEIARRETMTMWQEVVKQDFPFVEGTQATIEARDAAGIRTRFSPYWEEAVFRFQQMVLNAIEKTDR
jgi:choline monooxygenase